MTGEIEGENRRKWAGANNKRMTMKTDPQEYYSISKAMLIEGEHYASTSGYPGHVLLSSTDVRRQLLNSNGGPYPNTQPEGCTCLDCERYETTACPYPGSNITMTRCNSFMIDLKKYGLAIRTKAFDDALGYIHKDSASGKILQTLKDGKTP